ncbi:MAG TPA: amino acid adenylation domain-containing protein, partial [Thermoanaerobaculia bacterium]|nr:amino acid adenylation domain-containing protein [Thermoanaerobaculia bacterium]
MSARFTQVSTAHTSLVELLRARAFAHPDRRAYAFLADGVSETESFTYGELDARARAIGAALARRGARGERVLLLYPPGLEFIAAFFGCLYAGAVAVPCYPPRPRRDHPRLRAIARDARPRVALTTPELGARREAVVEHVPELAAADWLVTAGLDGSLADGWKEPDLAPETPAFLQYTSGSTSTPKGVIVTHGNVLHNEEMIRLAFGQSEESVVVGWLPLYHDMGLIGNVLQPLYAGATSVLMPPVAFLQRPARWLEAVSRYKATTSGGPNFAYDLCVRKIAPEDRARLDLSSWSLAFNGAEPVRAETLERFAETFAPCGFRREAFYPCYGLAEATLFVAGGRQGEPAAPTAPTAPTAVVEFDAAALERGRALPVGPAGEGSEGRILVGSGRAWSGQRIAIAGPESRQPLPPGRVGEIWVAGPSVAYGYWGRTEESAHAFGASLADGDGPFLRTGDLGFLWGGELFVTGRLKDLIILRGRNLYPQDVERTAERSHPALEPGAGAAFSADVRGEERLVVVHEVGRRFLRERGSAAEVTQAVRRAVAEEHEAQVYEVVLIRPGSLPKTSSGKVQRHACRAAWLAGELDVVGRDAAHAADITELLPAETVDRESLLRLALPERRAVVATFLLGELARVSGVAVSSLDLERPATDAGLDSLAAVELGHRIESALGVSIPLTRWLEAPTLADLAEDIVDRLEAEPAVVEAGPAPEVFPLSHGQRGLFFLERLAPESAAYNIAVPVRLAEDLDVQALQRSLLALTERHPALRTTFEEIEGEPRQRVHPVLAPEFSVEEWSEGALEREAYRPFDLGQGPLLRAKVFQGDREHTLLLVVHHLVADFWSLALMARELGALYRREALPALAATYADHVERERRLLAGPAGERLWAYWKDQLSGEVPDLDLPADRPRPPFQSWRGGSVALPLDVDLAALARRQGITLFTALLAGFEAVLHRWTGQEDFVVGSPSAGRSTADLAGVAGYFVNTLPLRADLAGDPSFRELLGRAGETVSGALAHDGLPFPLIAERLRPERDPARSPLFQAMLVFQRSHRPEERAWGAFALGEAGARADLLGLPVESIALAERRVPFDLTLTVAEGAEGLTASLQYVADLFDRTTAARLTSHLRTLLAAAVADPAQPLSELPLLSEAERRQLLEWGSGAAEAPAAKALLHQLFEAQAERTPEAVALVAGEERLTYRELDAWAESLAARLRALGVGPEERVGLCSRRSAALVAGLIAVLKAGGAYVPLDPAHPRPRLAKILADSRPLALLVEEGQDVLPEHDLPVVALSHLPAPPLPGRGEAGRERGPGGEGLAYLIYTSGSTGEPKGVAIRHAAAVSLICWVWSVFPDADLAAVLFSTSIGFDLSIFELFAPLSRGGAVVLAENALALPSLPAAGEVTLVNTVPSAMAGLLRLGGLPASLRAVCLAGEPLTRELAGRIFELPQVERVFNLYGPSEDTTYSTFALIGKEPEAPSIGRPVAGTRTLVVDRRLHLAPQGVPGELWLGGAGLARGYFGRPDLTAERWVPDPFSGLAGERLYRTGDLVRFRPDGELEFLGRLDHQVKVRGFRVEPGEIEASLVAHPEVHEAAVVAHGEGGERSLAAFVVPHGERLDVPALRSFLQERLPAHMVPSTFTVLADLPRTATGKVDRKALVRTAPERLAEPSAAPRGPIEELVAGLWTEMLGIEEIGAHDDFFSLGGHSLLALQVVARLREAAGVDLPLRAVFARPTVAGLAAEVETALRGGLGEETLTVLSREEPLPASFSQEQLWLFDRLRPGSAAYNLPVAIRLLGFLDTGRLAAALERLAFRHEALRTTLEAGSGGRLFQRVHPPVVSLRGIDLTALPAGERASEAARLAALEARRPFDLAQGPLFRTTLLRLDPRENRLLFVLHHAVADARSLEILFRDMAALYEGLALPGLPVQYADFAAWQRARLAGPALAELRTFWHERLRDMPPLLQLPADRPRPPVQTYRGATRSARLDGAEGVRALARAEGATPFMVLLAAFQTLVGRLTGQDDAGIGSPVSTRSRAELDGVAGFFVNTLVLRATSNDGSFRELLRDVRTGALDAFAHADLPFETLVEELAPERSASYSPLVQVLFALEGEPVPPLASGGLTWTAEGIDRGAAQFDLALGIAGTGDGLRASAEYSSDLFDATTVDRLLGRFGTLLAAALTGPDRPLATLPLLEEAERAQLLIEWNDTAAVIDMDTPVHEQIARQAGRTPDAPAVEVVGRPEQSLTYRELLSRAGQLAQRLRALGVGPEVTVGICVERSADIAVGVLGVLEAGGAYLPLDPLYPTDRLSFMIEDSGTPIVVTQERLRGLLPEVPARYLYLDGGETEMAAPSPARVFPENRAYVIYTSGSTGGPKGVMVTHRSLAHQAVMAGGLFGIGPDDRVLQFGSFSFDVAVEELFPSWCYGACVVFWPEAPTSGPAELTSLIERERLTCCNLIAQYWHEWVVELARSGSPLPSSLRFLMTGGDTVAADRLAVWQQVSGNRVAWWNGYGPTETTVTSTAYRHEAGAALSGATHSVPIGRPQCNERLYVVDRQDLPVPLGVPGELWIGGVGLARGYLSRPALTAERFIPDPFGEVPGERLYRTGDLVRYLPSGDLEFLGRIDSQVKLRGYRIELGEVESSLDACPMVLDAAVVLAGEGRERRLVAYVVPAGPEVTPRELRAWLRGVLPEPMVPSTFVLLPALPLSNSGKIDRRALARLTPEPDADAAAGFVAPRTAVEEILTGIWAEVLGLARVGVHDHFFELGGHSLLATQVVSRIREALELEVPLARLFEAPTPAALAPWLEEAGGPVAPPIRRVSRDRDLPLSFAQERLWFLDRLQPGGSAYNMVAALALRGSLSAFGLEAALGEVVRRHESLRTTFTERQGRPVQMVVPEVSWSLPRVDLSALPVSAIDGEVRRLVHDETRRPFDLERGPMLRGALLRRAADDHVLIFDMHHIASDGWSMGVLVREVSALYGAASPLRPLPPLPVQYADFAVWQREWLQGEALERQMGYWRERLEGAPVLDLPTDRPRPAVQSFQGASVHFAIGPAVTAELAALSRRHGATLFMTLLAGFAALLQRLTGQDDLVVGSPVANRNRAEIEPLIGFFVNTLVLRTRLTGAPAVADLLAEVRRAALGAYAHQDLPFERLVEELRPERHLSHNPLFQVMFALQNAPFGGIELAGLEAAPLDVELPTAKFDLGLTFTEVGDGLAVELDYATDLFDAVTAQRWAGYIETLLAGLAAEASVSDLPLLSVPERHQLLAEWNDTQAGEPAGALQRFEAQAAWTPEAEAVVFGAERLTYEQLDRKANGLARRLRDLGVEPGVRVGLSVERSPALAVGLLGIWKAGGAYVPMDPAHPKARLSYMQEDAGVEVVVTQELLADLGEEAGLADLSHAPAPEDVAYLIYTSGTTGQPKAVVVEHRQLAATLAAVQGAFGFSSGDRMPCVAPFSFDIFLFELLGPLLAGGTSVLMPLRPTLDVERLTDELESATLLHAVPALMRQVVEAARRRGGGENLRALFVGGDVVPAELLADLRETFPQADVWVLYGPTEAAIVCTAWRSDGTRSLLGRPFPGATVMLHDREGSPVPVGVPGEIWIGGSGVTRGYWRREELTAEKFIEGFFRSGDLARQLPDGTLEFLGRIDQQVKVRGFRIELGEVETALARHAEVREVVAAVREDQLVAYVVRQPVEVAPEEVSEHVSQWQTLYEETYGRSASADATFDVEGWNSSYTGEPIPAEEMREWVDRTVERVLALKPQKVLEIGCGTGLLLVRIAPHVERYLGTDFSRAALDGIRSGLDGLPQVELSQRTAEDWSGLEPGSFDVVVLNSVAQYFPGAEYLARVLEGAVRAVAPGGKIFVGDVRSLPLLDAMHASVELYRSPGERSVAELRRRVARRVADEEELVLGPGFFQQIPGVTGVEVLLKRGEHHNELTLFRYDVVMWVGGEEPPTCPPPLPSIPLPGGEGPLCAVETLLSGSAPDGFVLERLVNARVATEAVAVEMLSQEVETVAELRQAISERTAAGVDPEALARLAEDHGYTVELIADPDSPFHFGAILAKSRPSPPGRGAVGSGGGQVGGSLSSHANDPLRAKLARRLVPELRR